MGSRRVSWFRCRCGDEYVERTLEGSLLRARQLRSENPFWWRCFYGFELAGKSVQHAFPFCIGHGIPHVLRWGARIRRVNHVRRADCDRHDVNIVQEDRPRTWLPITGSRVAAPRLASPVHRCRSPKRRAASLPCQSHVWRSLVGRAFFWIKPMICCGSSW